MECQSHKLTVEDPVTVEYITRFIATLKQVSFFFLTCFHVFLQIFSFCIIIDHITESTPTTYFIKFLFFLTLNIHALISEWAWVVNSNFKRVISLIFQGGFYAYEGVNFKNNNYVRLFIVMASTVSSTAKYSWSGSLWFLLNPWGDVWLTIKYSHVGHKYYFYWCYIYIWQHSPCSQSLQLFLLFSFNIFVLPFFDGLVTLFSISFHFFLPPHYHNITLC